MKSMRSKVVRARLEKELWRYEKRIQKLASEAYQLRMMLEDLDVKEKDNAVHHNGQESSIGGGTADTNPGQSDISSDIIAAAVLGQQPEKLPNDSRDIGQSGRSESGFSSTDSHPV